LQSGVGRIFSALLAPTNSSGVRAGTLGPTLQGEQDALEAEAAVPYSSYKGNSGHPDKDITFLITAMMLSDCYNRVAVSGLNSLKRIQCQMLEETQHVQHNMLLHALCAMQAVRHA
jgi:hypothetical protein